MKETPKAFVLMPFAPEFTAIYSDLIRPALEDAGYEVARADSFLDQQNILRDVVQGIGSADSIVADLTTLNPNVLYELGLCHGLKVPTVLLAQSIEEVPFDLRGYRIQRYSTHFSEVHKLKEALRQIGEQHQRREVAFGSPITDFLTGDVLSSSRVTGETLVESSVPSVSEEEGDKGFIDFIIEANQASEQIASAMGDIATEIDLTPEVVPLRLRAFPAVGDGMRNRSA